MRPRRNPGVPGGTHSTATVVLAKRTGIVIMRVALKCLAILCLLLVVSASERLSRVNLTELLQKPTELRRMTLIWEYLRTPLFMRTEKDD